MEPLPSLPSIEDASLCRARGFSCAARARCDHEGVREVIGAGFLAARSCNAPSPAAKDEALQPPLVTPERPTASHETQHRAYARRAQQRRARAAPGRSSQAERATMAATQIDWAEDLVTEVVGERLKAATRKRGAEPLSHAIEAKKLRESWEALRVWLRAKLLAKRGASIPGFGRFTWQVLGDYKPSDLQDRPEELIPLRPVFQFSEDFCKAHLLPWRPIAEDKLVECADLNYSILALRHTSRLTKDMVWSALRDLQRKIGDRIASGYSLTLDFGS